MPIVYEINVQVSLMSQWVVSYESMSYESMSYESKNRVLFYLTFCYFFIFMSTRLFFVCFFVRRFVCLYAKYLQKY
jgi:hypothetical protein